MIAGGMPAKAAAHMARPVTACRIIAAGMAITAAARAGPVTQHTTIAMVCRGVIPTALNTPRSWTRSRVPSSTVFSTPSLATEAIISVKSVRNSAPVMTGTLGR
jgi:hypothetical protein